MIFMTQFLRLAVAGNALREGGGKGVTTDDLRKSLMSGNSIEVAGYELTPALVSAIDGLNLIDFGIPAAPIHWLDVKNESSLTASTVAQRVIAAWRNSGAHVNYEAIQGDPFWTTQEIVDAPNLIAVSTARYDAH
jgi:hypothetical protein